MPLEHAKEESKLEDSRGRANQGHHGWRHQSLGESAKIQVCGTSGKKWNRESVDAVRDWWNRWKDAVR
jgi:hypothetical protein